MERRNRNRLTKISHWPRGEQPKATITATRFILHVRCASCAQGYFLEPTGIIPPCVCGGRLRLLGVWDLEREAWPPTLPRPVITEVTE